MTSVALNTSQQPCNIPAPVNLLVHLQHASSCLPLLRSHSNLTIFGCQPVCQGSVPCCPQCCHVALYCFQLLPCKLACLFEESTMHNAGRCDCLVCFVCSSFGWLMSCSTSAGMGSWFLVCGQPACMLACAPCPYASRLPDLLLCHGPQRCHCQCRSTGRKAASCGPCNNSHMVVMPHVIEANLGHAVQYTTCMHHLQKLHSFCRWCSCIAPHVLPLCPSCCWLVAAAAI